MNDIIDACKKCKHVVAEHEYSFEIIDGHQV